MSYYMGIDLGTSSVKVIITDVMGKIKGIGQAGYEVLTPVIGYAQQDPYVWWDCTVLAIRQAFSDSAIQPEKVRGIGFSGQMHGMVALDQEGKPVCDAIIHLDGRSVKEREEIERIAGELVETELLNRPYCGMLICSLYWLKKHEAGIYDKIRYVMSPKDYIRYRLTGEIGSDYSDAGSTLAFSVKNGGWCMPLIQRLGLKEDIWPKICDSAEIVGQVTKEASELTGLSTETKVAAGSGDAMAARIGNGVVKEGIVACNIGTSSQLATVVSTAAPDPAMCCQIWPHSVPGTWVYQGGALNGGNTLSWLRDKALASEDPFSRLDALAGEVPAGSDGLLFLPYLAGERTPYNDPDAKGVYFGLTMKHDQRHMLRATMEGVLLNLSACQEVFHGMGIRQEKVIASGGGAKGSVWRQIQADVLNLPVYTAATEEEACLGAAIYAMVGCKEYASLEEACGRIITFHDTVTEPIQQQVKIYQEMKERFHALYRAVKELY